MIYCIFFRDHCTYLNCGRLQSFMVVLSSFCSCKLSSTTCNLATSSPGFIFIPRKFTCNLCSSSRFRAAISSIETSVEEDAAPIFCRFRGGKNKSHPRFVRFVRFVCFRSLFGSGLIKPTTPRPLYCSFVNSTGIERYQVPGVDNTKLN